MLTNRRWLTSNPSILDLYCCGGGASMGLHNAGFNVVGIDIDRQPHYPFPFLQADALALNPKWIASFSAVWASPPCQRYTRHARQKGTTETHPDLIGSTRDMLDSIGIPYVIENVPEAPLRTDLILCGAMFGLKIVRHRHFEINGFTVAQPEHIEHAPDYITVTGNPGGSSTRDGMTHFGNTTEWKEVMGIDWLPASKIKEAIPPVYSQYIGTAILNGQAVKR